MADQRSSREKRRVFGIIAAMVSVGLLLGGALLWLYRVACAERSGGICKMVVDSPPWLLLTGVIAGPCVLLTWYWRTVHKEADIRLATEAHFTERFARAVELIGNASLPVRLGGIYALERLARDSGPDRPVIVETLAAFVRLSTVGAMELLDIEQLGLPDEDVRAAVSVLGRRRVTDREPSVNLARTNLMGVVLSKASFVAADFANAVLADSTMFECDFRASIFEEAVMTESTMQECDFRASNFKKAVLVDAKMLNCNLSGANFLEASLTRALLRESNFCGANLRRANLEGANLTNADLTEADLKGAEIEGAIFRGAKLSKEAYEQAKRGGTVIQSISADDFSALLRVTT